MDKSKFSWDRVESPVHAKDLLILAPPGFGYESMVTVAAKLKMPVRNLGDCGFRSSSYYPFQWLIHLDDLYYQTTAPWNKPTVWIGFAQNVEAVSCLPFCKVFKVIPDPEAYKTRIIAYRRKVGLPVEGDLDIIKDLMTLTYRLASFNIPAITLDGTVLDNCKVAVSLLNKFSKPTAVYTPKVIDAARNATAS